MDLRPAVSPAHPALPHRAAWQVNGRGGSSGGYKAASRAPRSPEAASGRRPDPLSGGLPPGRLGPHVERDAVVFGDSNGAGGDPRVCDHHRLMGSHLLADLLQKEDLTLIHRLACGSRGRPRGHKRHRLGCSRRLLLHQRLFCHSWPVTPPPRWCVGRLSRTATGRRWAKGSFGILLARFIACSGCPRTSVTRFARDPSQVLPRPVDRRHTRWIGDR